MLTHPSHADLHECAHPHITHTLSHSHALTRTCRHPQWHLPCPSLPRRWGPLQPMSPPPPPPHTMRRTLGPPGAPQPVPWHQARLPALTPHRVPGQPHSHHLTAGNTTVPVLSTLRPAWPPGATEQKHRELSPAAGMGEAQGQRVGNMRQGSSLLLSAPCSQVPHTAQKQGTRVTSGHHGSGSLWGHGLLPQDQAQNHIWASRCGDGVWPRQDLQALWPEASESVDAPAQALLASAPGTGVLRVHEVQTRPCNLCASV